MTGGGGMHTPSHQEPITRSLHLPYILESTFARIFLFLEQFSPQASLNSQESVEGVHVTSSNSPIQN